MALIYTGGLTDTSFTTGETNAGWDPSSYLYGGDIVIPSSGTVTQMGAYLRCNAAVSINLKFGLYTSGGSLVAQSTASYASNTIAWVNSGAISGSVSAGTYYVLLSASDPGGGNYIRYQYSNAGNGSFATEAYATAMQSTESITAGGDAGQLYGVRLDFTAGGGGAPLDAYLTLPPLAPPGKR